MERCSEFGVKRGSTQVLRSVSTADDLLTGTLDHSNLPAASRFGKFSYQVNFRITVEIKTIRNQKIDFPYQCPTRNMGDN